MTTTEQRPCRYCDETHEPRYLCDPARRVLDAMVARGMSFNMPTLAFPEPIPAAELGLGLGLGPDDRLVVQVSVMGAVVPDAGGVIRPAVIFTGRDAYGAQLPRWLYAADDDGMNRLAQLVREMTALAKYSAAKERRLHG